jgi:hypothetical protein
MAPKDPPKPRFWIHFLIGYAFANVLLFFVEPYGSRWHYHSHSPIPIEEVAPTDAAMSIDDIRDILDSIDLAYKAREPTAYEKLWSSGESLIQMVFLPSSVALWVKNFIGYMGPSTSKQREFTLSVKRRYNHLAILAVKKGMREDGFLYQLDPSFSKKNGQAFSSLR